jgi:hypothetical protein
MRYTVDTGFIDPAENQKITIYGWSPSEASPLTAQRGG